MITANIFVSSSNVERTLLLIKAASCNEKLPGADFMRSLLLQRYTTTSPFEGRSLKQWIHIHSMLYLKSFELGSFRTILSKTVIWVWCRNHRLLSVFYMLMLTEC